MCVFDENAVNIWSIVFIVAGSVQILFSMVSINSARIKNKAMKTFNEAKPDEFTYCTLSSLQVTWSIILLLLMVVLNVVNLFKILKGTDFKNY
jgi:hypothetical protein